ncbi:MAG: energy transducer TonB [Bryobacteraceae bacterium]
MTHYRISDLNRALELDPQASDASAYLNLLMRERADLREMPQEHRKDIATTPPPPPPPLAPPGGEDATPRRIRFSGPVRIAKLIRRVAPDYPPVAKRERVQGTVRFAVTIDESGYVRAIQLVSGHPLLVPEGIAAVRQWVYLPALLNREPIEVTIPAEVNFVLPAGGPGI